MPIATPPATLSANVTWGRQWKPFPPRPKGRRRYVCKEGRLLWVSADPYEPTCHACGQPLPR